MHPILFRIGSVSVYTYGVLLAAAFTVGMLIAAREASIQGENPEKVLDLTFYILIGSLLGARLLYVVVEWDLFKDNLWEIPKIWKGGFVYYGGLFFGIAIVVIYSRIRRMNVWRVLDILAISLAIGLFVGRWACFSAGCCYGKPTHLPWGVVFHDPLAIAPTGVRLHPTQIYLSINGLIMYFVLIYIRRHKVFHGQVALFSLIYYSVTRFLIEFLRGDPRGWVIENVLSTSQFISIPVFIASVILYVYLLKKHTPPPVDSRENTDNVESEAEDEI